MIGSAFNAYKQVTHPTVTTNTTYKKVATFTPSYLDYARSSDKAYTDAFASDLDFAHLFCGQDQVYPYNCGKHHNTLATKYSSSYDPYASAYQTYKKANTKYTLVPITTTSTTPYQFNWKDIAKGIILFGTNINNNLSTLSNNQKVISGYEKEQWDLYYKQQQANTCGSDWFGYHTCTQRDLDIIACKDDLGCELYTGLGRDIDEHIFYLPSFSVCVITQGYIPNPCKTSKAGMSSKFNDIQNYIDQDLQQTKTYFSQCQSGSWGDCNEAIKSINYPIRATNSVITGTVNTVTTCATSMYNSAFNGQTATNQQALSCADTSLILYGASTSVKNAWGVGGSVDDISRPSKIPGCAFNPEDLDNLDKTDAFALLSGEVGVSACADDIIEVNPVGSTTIAPRPTFDQTPKHQFGSKNLFGGAGTKSQLNPLTGQNILDKALDVGPGNKIGIDSSGQLYRFMSHDLNKQLYHGYEVSAIEIVKSGHQSVFKQMLDNGQITKSQYNKLISGKNIN